ncbi:MAG: pectin acetylesterase-family hydrolase [Myxococcota bacterium]
MRALLSLVFVMGCDAEEEQTESDQPLVPELSEGWNELPGGGETICSRGDDYAFFVRKGTVNRVVVDFQGGGACWNAGTCGLADAIFSDSVDGVRDALMNTDDHQGIIDTNNEENPFADWYHVVVPYCTGDIHWGDATTDYGAVTIEHKGGVNAKAVVDWVADNFIDPEHVFVTGCSAGAYGAIMWTPSLIEAYPNATIAQLGDSGAGIVTADWFAQSFPSWNAESSFPTWIPALDPSQNDVQGLELTDLYTRIGTFYPDVVFSQYNSSADGVQQFFFGVMGGEEDQWRPLMVDSIETIREGTPNFRAYLESADRHCIIPGQATYDVQVGDTRFIDWMTTLAEGGTPEDVACPECVSP